MFFENQKTVLRWGLLVFWTGLREVQGHMSGLWEDTAQSSEPSGKQKMKGEVLVQVLWGQEDSSDIIEQEIVMSPSDRLWLHHPHCCHWMRAELGPVCLMPGLLQSMSAKLRGEASIWLWYWTVLWGLLAETLGTRPYSHHLHFPGLPGSGSRGPTEYMHGSRGELGGDTSTMVAVGWGTATAWPCEGVDVICKQNTAINKSHPLKLGWPKCLFLFLTHKVVGEFWQPIELCPFSLWESRVWGAVWGFLF